MICRVCSPAVRGKLVPPNLSVTLRLPFRSKLRSVLALIPPLSAPSAAVPAATSLDDFAAGGGEWVCLLFGRTGRQLGCGGPFFGSASKLPFSGTANGNWLEDPGSITEPVSPQPSKAAARVGRDRRSTMLRSSRSSWAPCKAEGEL